jgi:hypothetical protein
VKIARVFVKGAQYEDYTNHDSLDDFGCDVYACSFVGSVLSLFQPRWNLQRSRGGRSQFEYSTCFLGCTSGDCNNDGGSGECCGNHYYSAVIYPDGGECHGGDCGFIRVRVAKERIRRSVETDLNRGAFYRAPGLRYVPDRFAHTYAVIVGEALPAHAGGF